MIPGITTRICEHVWYILEGEPEKAVEWLQALGCTLTYEGTHEWHFKGSSGITGGFTDNGDPNNTAVLLAFLTLGEHWPFIVPDLQATINKQWKERAKRREH